MIISRMVYFQNGWMLLLYGQGVKRNFGRKMRVWRCLVIEVAAYGMQSGLADGDG
jgi:hypothetical protein